MSKMEPSQGLPMTREAFLTLIAEPQPYHYEWRDGLVYALPGGTGPHSAIAEKLSFLIRGHIGWLGPCQVYHDRFVEIPQAMPLLPDLVISCTRSDWLRAKATGTNKATIQYPRLIAEVLSEDSTGPYDRTEKRLLYQRCPTLDVYLLCSQKQAEVTIFRRATNWQEENLTGHTSLPLPEFGFTLALDDIYLDILRLSAEFEEEN